jgi:transcriptional regulator with XRE-family HTH domain
MPEDVRKLVGRRIRHFREKKGWSQEKLAEMSDLDRTYIGRIERRMIPVTLGSGQRVATGRNCLTVGLNSIKIR